MRDSKFNEKLSEISIKRLDVDMEKLIDAFKNEKWSYFKEIYGVKPMNCSQAEALIQKRFEVKNGK